MAGKTPVFKIPPAPAKKSTSERGTFDAFIRAHPALKPYSGLIWTNATNYGGITPTQLAAVLWAESKGNPGAKSSAGAKGIGQIWDTKADAVNAAGVPFFRSGNLNISDADKANPAFAIQYAAWRLSGYATTHGGSIDQIWIGGYNPNYRPGVDGPANFISQYLPKGYVGTPSSTIDQSATKSVQTSAVTAGLKDPWIVQTRQGIKFVGGTLPPKGALQWFGLPMTRSQFLQYQNSLDATYLAYTGKRATAGQVANVIKNGWSTTQVQMQLAATPAFKNSPIWKQNAPSYIAAWQNIYGPNSKPDPKALTYAIVHNLDTTAFQQTLRSRKDYTTSQEFKQKTAALSGTYTQIYGVPDENGNNVIKQAAKNGYDANQFANYLRQQPQYTSSDEFKANAMGWAQKMGLLNTVPGTEASASLATASTPAPPLPVTQQTPAAAPPPQVVDVPPNTSAARI